MNVEQRQALGKTVKGLDAMTKEYDAELAHSEAEDLLCDILTELGYGERCP